MEDKQIIELFFARFKEQEYSYDNDIPDADTSVQNQVAVVFKGTDDEFGKIVGSPLFAETCIGFFHQAIKNHYYGFDRVNYHNKGEYTYVRIQDQRHLLPEHPV